MDRRPFFRRPWLSLCLRALSGGAAMPLAAAILATAGVAGLAMLAYWLSTRV